jgi:N-acetyl-anhydromuramyl-L-alanine amidase AmpD
MRIDKNGWLFQEGDGSQVVYLPTVRTYALVGPRPLAIVWHATGAGGEDLAERLARRIQTYRAGVDRAVSFHVVVARSGAVFQCAPFCVGTWHVGRPGEVAGRAFDNVNRVTIGIELENAGRLREIDGQLYAWPYYAAPAARASERRADPRYLVPRQRAALFSDGRLYDGFTPAQLATAEGIIRACSQRYGLDRRTSAYAHADFAAPTKEDPGPVWIRGHLPRLLANVFGETDLAARREPRDGGRS